MKKLFLILSFVIIFVKECMRYIVLCTFIFSAAFTQTVIGEGLSGMELWNYVIANYKTSSTLGYTKARDTLYSVIDVQEGNQLSCVYSGFTITLDIFQDPSTDAYRQGINCEHTFPQSMGADSEPQKSDMHHLFPCKSNVNSSRGNHPYAEIPDEDTDKWYRNDTIVYTIPTEFIEEFAEKYNSDNLTDKRFEPREDHKGNAARAMFYFFAMYHDEADTDFWDVQDSVLLQWHYYDEVDEWENNRTWRIANYQEYPNPFILDSTLARRIWYHQTSLAVEYAEGWNLVGLPLEVENAAYNFLFPESIDGTLYSYDGGYVSESELSSGSGYWLKFDGDGVSSITGVFINELTISLSEGWNLITGISNSLNISDIQDPDGIIISDTVYGFTPDGYENAEILESGTGYWLRANNTGTIIISD